VLSGVGGWLGEMVSVLAPGGWKCECDDGYKLLPYPAFTGLFVTGWGEEWVMSRAAILVWLEQNQADRNKAAPARV
jgi:hypothetical protein